MSNESKDLANAKEKQDKIFPAPVLLEETKAEKTRPRSPFLLHMEGTPEELDAQIVRNKRRKIIVIAVTVAVLCVAILTLWLWWTSAGQRIRRSLNENKLNQAISIYQEDLAGKNATKEKELLSNALDEKIEDSLEKYYRGAIKVEEMRAVLDEIAAFDFYLNPATIDTAQDKITQRELSRAAYAEGLAQIEAQDYVSALKSLAQVEEADPNYEQAKIQLEFATKSYVDGTIQAADELSRAKNFTAAVARIDQALKVLPLSRELKDKRAALKKAEEEEVLAKYLQDANKLAADGAYLDAIDLLRSDVELAKLPAVQSAIDIFSKQYVTRALRWAEEDLGRRDYDAAINTLENALWHWYDDSLQVKLNDVYARRPRNFVELSSGPNALYSTGEFDVISSKDEHFTSGNMAKFSGSQSLTTQNASFATYTLDQEFVRFDGTIVIPKEIPLLQSMSLVISDQDGAILYSSPTLNSGTGSLHFSLDVSGVSSLTIKQNMLDILPVEHVLYIYEGLFHKE